MYSNRLRDGITIVFREQWHIYLGESELSAYGKRILKRISTTPTRVKQSILKTEDKDKENTLDLFLADIISDAHRMK